MRAMALIGGEESKSRGGESGGSGGYVECRASVTRRMTRGEERRGEERRGGGRSALRWSGSIPSDVEERHVIVADNLGGQLES